jgi:hypothetical protein
MRRIVVQVDVSADIKPFHAFRVGLKGFAQQLRLPIMEIIG